jgi:DNA-binding transcriptional LysR family regulator
MSRHEADAGRNPFANLRRLTYFAAVVETGTFTAAAERLGVTKAVVSQQVSRLEEDFRTALLIRSTRKVTPTEAGRSFYERCALILREAGDAFDELSGVAAEPSGTLRLTAPFDYGLTTVVQAVVAFSSRYPQCRVEVALSDQSLDLLSGQVELAVRVGWLTDLQLQARQIGTFRQWLVASPEWAARVDPARGPQQIRELPFVAHSGLKTPGSWSFAHSALERQAVSVEPALYFDATLAVREAVRCGAGLSVLPDYAVAAEVESGRLVHLLPDWTLPSGGIHVVYPAARFRSAKVRAFVDVLAQCHRSVS